MARLPTQLAKAQVAAALAQYGDAARAAAAYDAALTPGPPRAAASRYVDYGSELRDSGAVLAFAAANRGTQTRLTAVIDRIAERFVRATRTSTQEQAWLLMAAEAAVKTGGGSMTVATGSGAPETRSEPLYLRRPLGSGGPEMTITNRGDTPAWRTVSITGVTRADLPGEDRQLRQNLHAKLCRGPEGFMQSGPPCEHGPMLFGVRALTSNPPERRIDCDYPPAVLHLSSQNQSTLGVVSH
jgi:uncharacterized protein YfaS (alpha-2-macroglobulin family)